MMEDPRRLNETPAADSVAEYFTGYLDALHAALKKVDASKLQEAFAVMEQALRRRARIYVAGNGGSSAIADHLCCDWLKGTHVPGEPALRVHSLTANSSLLTALANDFGYENSVAKQVEMLGEAGDVLVLISSSGNSANIVAAAEQAVARGMTVIGLSGFAGGKLAQVAHLCLHVPVNNYGMAEDGHQVVMHVLSQYLARKRDLAQ